MMNDRLERTPDIAEQFANLIPAGCETPLREIDLGIGSEQIEDRAARRCDATVVKCLEILQRHRFALFVCHSLCGECHGCLLLYRECSTGDSNHLLLAVLRPSPPFSIRERP